MEVNEAIEKVGKDTQSVDLYADIPEVKPEEMKLQAVAPVSYVAAVEQSKKDRERFFKSIEARKEATKDALENTEESRFKRMNKSTGKSNLNVNQPGLKKMHLDESLFEGIISDSIIDDDGWDYEALTGTLHGDVFNDLEKLLYELQRGRRGIYTNATTVNELADYLRTCAESLEGVADYIEDSDELNESIQEFGKDEKTGLSYGINGDGELYFGDNKSGYNLKDTPENRNHIANDWEEDTGKKVDSKFFDPKMLDESKRSLKEATIIGDVKTFRPWGVAVDTYNKIQEEDKLDDLEKMIEEMYPDGIESQTFNDLLGYDQDFLYQMLNIKVEEE